MIGKKTGETKSAFSFFRRFGFQLGFVCLWWGLSGDVRKRCRQGNNLCAAFATEYRIVLVLASAIVAVLHGVEKGLPNHNNSATLVVMSQQGTFQPRFDP